MTVDELADILREHAVYVNDFNSRSRSPNEPDEIDFEATARVICEHFEVNLNRRRTATFYFSTGEPPVVHEMVRSGDSWRPRENLLSLCTARRCVMDDGTVVKTDDFQADFAAGLIAAMSTFSEV